MTLLPSAVSSQKTSQDIEESDSHSETKELEQQPESVIKIKLKNKRKQKSKQRLVLIMSKNLDFKRNHMVKKYLYRKET